LGIPIVHEVVLHDKGIPAIALIEVKPWIKPGNTCKVRWKALLKKRCYRLPIFFVTGMADVNVPPIEFQGKVRKLGD
jgi:hypothetical protein